MLKWPPPASDATPIWRVLAAEEAHYAAEERLFTTIYASQGIDVRPKRAAKPSATEVRQFLRERSLVLKSQQRVDRFLESRKTE